jgi:hypothetical protein
MKLTTIALATAFALSAVFAHAQTNPGGGTRATGYPTAEKKANDTSDPLIRKPTSGQRATKNRAPGVTTGTSIGPRAPATGAPTSSQQGVGTNGG